jgi:hypothetical protein
MKPFIPIVLFFFTILSFAQTTISGKIVDEKNKPIPNANIFIDGSYDGATSNSAGEFSFTTTAEGNQTLIVSALSFEIKKIEIGMNKYQNQTLILKRSATELNEVVITAGTLEAGDKSRVSVL